MSDADELFDEHRLAVIAGCAWLALLAVLAGGALALLLIAAAVARSAPWYLLALLPVAIGVMEPLWVWRARPYRYRVRLREASQRDAALAFCAPMGRRCHPFVLPSSTVFTFARERDAVAFKLGWG